LALTYLLDGIYAIIWGSSADSSGNCAPLGPSLYACALGLRRALLDGVALFLMRKGAGKRSVLATAQIAVPWGLFTGGTEFLWRYEDCNRGEHTFAYAMVHFTEHPVLAVTATLECMYLLILLVFYSTLALAPAYVLYRRPSLDFKYVYWQLITIILVCIDTVLEITEQHDTDFCLHWIYILFLQCLLGPFVVLSTLRADSAYWQGLLVPSKERSSRAESRMLSHDVLSTGSATGGEQALTITEPLLGQFLQQDAAEELAVTMDALSNCPNCEFLHFGLLSLDPKPIHVEGAAAGQSANFDILGVGGASKVYRGRLMGEPVAIKMIWCVDITVDTIKQFKREVMLLANLARHPNLIQVRGFSVMPPALCVVMELCNGGSLFDVVRKARESGTLLDWSVRLRLASQCAEAVAYLHSRMPPIVHKDIKSSNFLVIIEDSQMHVRLADLGSAIEMMAESSRSESSDGQEGAAVGSTLIFKSSSGNLDKLLSGEGIQRTGSSRVSFSSDEWRGSDCITPNWAAPEVLRHGMKKTHKPVPAPASAALAGSAQRRRSDSSRSSHHRSGGSFGAVYTPAADIFSLGVVFWELLTHQEPFPDLTFKEIATQVGKHRTRLAIPTESPQRFAALIERMWDINPADRPSASLTLREIHGMATQGDMPV